MGSMSEARPPASRLARADSRPILVTVLVTGWLILSAFGAFRAILVLGYAAVSSGTGHTDSMERVAAAAPDLVTDEMRQVLAQRRERRSLERNLAIPLLLVAAFGVVGAIALLRRRPWSRAALVAVGVLAIGLSAFHAQRSVKIMAAPAAGHTEDPDAENALALLRAASGIGLALQSIPLVVAMALLRHPIVRDWATLPEDGRRRVGRAPDPLLLVAGAALLIAAGAVFFSKSRSPAIAKEAEPAAAGIPEPSETFRWGDQPIAFSPPAGGWTRERHAEGGRRGVSFTRYATPPSRIIVAEATLQPAPASVDDVLQRLRLTEERFKFAGSATVGEPVRAVVAGAPAFQTDYSLRERSMQHRGREFLTEVGGHAFVFSFLGRDTDLAVFENLVSSVRFPAAGVEGDGALRPGTEEAAPEEKEGGALTKLRVGEQSLTVRVPREWERIDYGQRQEFRRGEARILLVDAGEVPAEAAGDVGDERVIGRALSFFDHDPRRWVIAAKTRIRVGEKEALAVDTWEPLSHVPHNRVILFANRERLLVAGIAQGAVEKTKGALDELARSIRFAD